MTEPSVGQDLHPEEDLLVAVALGQADHAARDEVVRHLGVCRSCRRDYDDLAGAVELVLPAVPRLAPPPTFEARVLARLDALRHPATVDAAEQDGAGAARRPGRRAVLQLAAAGLLGLVAGAGVTAALVRPDEEPSDTPWSAALLTGEGVRVGRVSQSYDRTGDVLVVEVEDGPVGRRYTCRLLLADGSVEDVAEWSLSADHANSWVVPVAGTEPVAVELVAESGRVWATAEVGRNPD